ncbi:hypothetical protein C8Q76DRAFT_252145 [Earliella scabrosa]|nr:hypothetical protein C8Q76DRAFT_250163 [Earliella scabrosa]KAI0694821.1 hypothetical protein C8Q76DRAFT_252145 [Earliella scabrosa]
MARKGQTSKRKASSPPEEEDETDDSDRQDPPGRKTRRKRKVTEKQAKLDQEHDGKLQRQIDKLKKENARLLAQQAQTAENSATADQELDGELGPESEDEDESIVEARRSKSMFESRGIYDPNQSSTPKKLNLRRAGDPKAPVSKSTTPRPTPPAENDQLEGGSSGTQDTAPQNESTRRTPPKESSHHSSAPRPERDQTDSSRNRARSRSHSRPRPPAHHTRSPSPRQSTRRSRSRTPGQPAPRPRSPRQSTRRSHSPGNYVHSSRSASHSTPGPRPSSPDGRSISRPRSRTPSRSTYRPRSSSPRAGRHASRSPSLHQPRYRSRTPSGVSTRRRSQSPRSIRRSHSRSRSRSRLHSRPRSRPRSRSRHTRQSRSPRTAQRPRSSSASRRTQQRRRSRSPSSRSRRRSRSPTLGPLPHASTSSAPSPGPQIEPPFRNGQNPTGDPKASDYEPHVTKMILSSCRDFEVRVCTEDPWPNPKTQDIWARTAWTSECHKTQLDYKLTDRVKGLITERTSNARSTLRNKALQLIAASYQFSPNTTEAAKLENRSRYTRLIHGDGDEPEPVFHYQDIDTLDGFAQNAIISNLIRNEWFRDSHSVGIRFSSNFSPIRPVTLALVFTAVCSFTFTAAYILVQFLYSLKCF